MKHNTFNLFLISESLNGLTKLPIQTFISSDFDTAKLYFIDWLKGKKVKNRFTLYKIGDIDKNFHIKETKIFIANGYEEEKVKTYQRTLLEEKKMIEEASREKTIKETIKKLFNGREIC